MKKPARILVSGMALDNNRGGVETYIMNIYRHCDRDMLQFDFAYNSKRKMAYADEIRTMGGHIFQIPRIRDGAVAHYKGYQNVYGTHHYIGAYFATGAKLRNLDFFRYAKKFQVPIRVLHSHNNSEMPVSKADQWRERYVERHMDQYVNQYFACSEEAGKWMFGDRKFKVLANGIDTEQFSYQPEIRADVRRKYNLGGKLVVGTVGRLAEQKNPFYILEIFAELKKINPNTSFLHVGDGPLREPLEKRARELKIKEDYHFIGQTDQTAEYLNAMDVFLLPSKFEGFPMVLVEAQSAGLPCFVANNITHDCKLTNNMYFLDINRRPSDWAYKVNQIDPDNRKDQTSFIINAGYDIHQTAKKFQDYFLSALPVPFN